MASGGAAATSGGGVPASASQSPPILPQNLSAYASGSLLKGLSAASETVTGGQPKTTGLGNDPALQARADRFSEALGKQQGSLAGVFAQAAALTMPGSPVAQKVPPQVKEVLEQILGLRLGGQGSSAQTPMQTQAQTTTGTAAQTGLNQAGAGQGTQSQPAMAQAAAAQPGGAVTGSPSGTLSSPLTGADIRAAIGQSGLLNEAGKAKARSGGTDLKGLLGQLKGLLKDLGLETGTPRPLSQPGLPSLTNPPRGQAQQSSHSILANLLGTQGGAGNASAASGGAAAHQAALLQEAMKGLAKETDSALARLRLTQMAARGLTSGDDTPAHTGRTPMDVVLELPLAVGTETAVLQMQVGRDRDGNADDDEASSAWRLRFALDTVQTGAVEASVSLRGEGTYISLWLDRQDTYDGLKASETLMQAAFAEAGMDLQELRFIRGLPVKASRAGSQVDRQS